MPLRVQGNTTNIEHNGKSKTGTHLSTNIYIAVDIGTGPQIVGAVQNLAVTETRSIKKIPEVGTDGFIDSAPNASTDINGTCKRVRFDGVRIAEAFRRGFVHVHSQREPFDIQIYDIIQDAEENVIITTIKNVWIKSISYTYNAEEFVIVDEMSWDAESIQSGRGHSSPGPAVSGTNPLSINQFEQEADVGDYRGALDEAGLVGAFGSGGAYDGSGA